MSSRPERPVVMIALIVPIALVAAAAGRAEANAGAPWQGGARAGELGGIGAISIAREDLVIDLRPLARSGTGLVEVSATYHLDNPSGAKRLDLVFATGSDAAGFRVTLDGRPVAFELAPDAELPASWRPPDATPRFDGGELDYHLRREATPVGFQLDVPPGHHVLSISYGADAIWYHRGERTVLRQFAYVLSPARTWAGFGGLDVTVHVPPGWRAAVTPAMPREGDTLRASFASVPADAIALTVQAPVGVMYTLLRYATGALLALVSIGGYFVVVRWTRARERRRLLKPASALAALGRGFVWGLAVLAAGLLAVFGPDLALPDGQVDHRGHGVVLLLALTGVALASLAALLIGAIVSYGVAKDVARSMHAMPGADR